MRAALLILVIISLAPLFKPGLYTSHDGENHLVRLAYFHKYLSEGSLVPKWIFELNSGLGYPIFFFINPLPYYLGSVARFVSFSIPDSTKITLFIATLFGAFGMYYWIFGLVKNRSLAFLAAALYIFTPYRFVDIFVRLALSEIVFLAIIPWAFYKSSTFILSLLILSHTQLSAMFFPLLFIYSILVKKTSQFILNTSVAIGISAFFWLPSVVLISYTKFDSLAQFSPSEHIPTLRQLVYSPWGFGFSHPGPADEMSFQVGIASWLSLVFGTAVAVLKKDRVLKFCIAVSWAAVVLMSTNLFGIWDSKIMYFIQFPWRLLAITLIIIPAAAALSLRYLPGRVGLLAVTALLLVSIYTNRNHIQTNMSRYENVSDSYFFQSHKTTTATPDELMPKSTFPKNHPVIPVSYTISGVSVILLLLRNKWKKFPSPSLQKTPVRH